MFRECPQLAHFLETADAEPSDRQLAEVEGHVLQCEICQRQISRCRTVAQDLQRLDSDNGSAGPHLSELDIAHFAVHGLRAPNAVDITHHLSLCPDCRRQVADTIMAVREFESIEAKARASKRRDSLDRRIRLAFSSPQRAVLALGAGVTFLAECFSLALALALLVGAFIGGADSLSTAVGVWPLSEPVDPVLRLAVAVIALVAAGLTLRHLAAVLFARATEQIANGAQGDDVDGA